MNREECLSMIMTKKCMNQPMHCIGDACETTEEPKVQNVWLADLFFNSYHCMFSKKTIYSEKIEQPIFTDAQTTCMPKDYFCIKDNFAIVWNDDIIHTCPYFKVKQMTMNVTNDIALGDGILLQLQETLKDCNIEIIRRRTLCK